MSVIVATTITMASSIAGYRCRDKLRPAGRIRFRFDILLVTVPGTFLGCVVGCLFVFKRGHELKNDPEFQRRVAEGEFESVKAEERTANIVTKSEERIADFPYRYHSVVLMGSIPELRPEWNNGTGMERMSIPTTL